MSWEEWKDMPRRPGWKHEYWDGYAHLSPRSALVYLRRVLYPQEALSIPEIPEEYRLRTVERSDAKELEALYVASFEDTVEFFGWTQERVLTQAREDSRAYLEGTWGQPSPHSRVAELRDGNLAGAALVVHPEYQPPALALLMAHPAHRRRGLAAAAIGWAARGLHQDGERVLRTACHIANEDAATFYRAMEFVEEEDLFLAQLRRSHYFQEWERLQRLGSEETAEAHREYQRWHKAEVRLRELANSEGPETAIPDRLHPPR